MVRLWSGRSCDYLNVPGLETHTQTVALGIAESYIIEVLKLFENICFGKMTCEIVDSKPDTAHVKIPDSVKGISRRRQRSRSQ